MKALGCVTIGQSPREPEIEAMKTLVRDITGVPALLPTSLVARVAAEAL